MSGRYPRATALWIKRTGSGSNKNSKTSWKEALSGNQQAHIRHLLWWSTKRRAIDGCALITETLTPKSRRIVTLYRDRRKYSRAFKEPNGSLHLTSSADIGRLAWTKRIKRRQPLSPHGDYSNGM